MIENIQELKDKVAELVKDSANNIDAYLASDVPIEFNRYDIDYKIGQLKQEILNLIDSLNK